MLSCIILHIHPDNSIIIRVNKDVIPQRVLPHLIILIRFLLQVRSNGKIILSSWTVSKPHPRTTQSSSLTILILQRINGSLESRLAKHTSIIIITISQLSKTVRTTAISHQEISRASALPRTIQLLLLHSEKAREKKTPKRESTGKKRKRLGRSEGGKKPAGRP